MRRIVIFLGTHGRRSGHWPDLTWRSPLDGALVNSVIDSLKLLLTKGPRWRAIRKVTL